MVVTTHTTNIAPALIYSAIPTFERAKALRGTSTNLDHWLASLKPAFRDRELRDKFGVCLVHRHYDIFFNEVVVSSPVQDPNNPNLKEVTFPRIWSQKEKSQPSPERWMYGGLPFEFSTTRCEAPPKDLQDDFDKAIDDWTAGNVGINAKPERMDVLGIYYRGAKPPAGKILLEKTWFDQRKSTLELSDPIPCDNERYTETCWYLDANNDWCPDYICEPPTHALQDPSN